MQSKGATWVLQMSSAHGQDALSAGADFVRVRPDLHREGTLTTPGYAGNSQTWEG